MSLDDQQLEQLARRLGTRAEARLDPDEVAEGVVERLRSEPARVVRRRGTPVLSALAAAAVLVLAIGIVADNSKEVGDLDLAFAETPAELQELSVDELAEVYDSLSFSAPVYELTNAGLEDLSVSQLEELLRTMMED